MPLLVASCDRYADVWAPFFQVFRHRWPDCPFPVYLGSNHRLGNEPRVTSLLVGDDASWASGVRRMLDQLESDYVIFFLEDFLIKKPVATNEVLRIVETATTHGAACVRLSPLPFPSRLPEQRVESVPFLGVVEPGTPYRVSAQPAVWRVDALRRYLVPGFTPWEFELLGSQLSEYQADVFWGPFQPSIDYNQFVEKGKWKPEGLRICREAGAAVDLSARAAFTESELEAHHQAGVPDSRQSRAKLAAIEAFRQGRRIEGLTSTLRLLAQRPAFVQLWAIALFGVAGPRAIEWLRRQHLRRQVREALSREGAVSDDLVALFL